MKKENKKIKKIPQLKIPVKKPSNWNKALIFLIMFSLIIAYIYPRLIWVQPAIRQEISLNTFTSNFDSWIYTEVKIDETKATAIQKNKKNNQTVKDIVILPSNDSLKELWIIKNDKNVDTKINIVDQSAKKFWNEVWPTILMTILFLFVAMIIIKKMWWVTNNAMTFWKSRAKLYDQTKEKILFKDVAWAEEEKEELKEVVDFLKSWEKYKKMWAKIPKWILLVWPPWTWKTLLARAVAGESGVPFLSISGSEFVEMFVWVWASRVRDLFENAKKIAPAIIFIDEIDAIWKKRWPGLWGWHDEREQTLNQILTEMDWFDKDTHVIVMAATNRADVLDKALLRPGRFDRKITINLPNLADRENILKVHAKWKPMSDDIDFKAFASSTVWFSWADLWNLINESAILAARYNQTKITTENIQMAFEKIVMWLTKKSQVMNETEKKITAYHEVGHALVWKLLPNTDPVHKVSIVSRWWALWVTWFLPERDSLLTSKAKFLDELATLYWWRVAEEIFFGKDYITTWASSDISRATQIARAMVTRYWMDEEIWAENFAPEWIEWNYLWAEWNGKVYSEDTQKLIDKKVKEILNNAYLVAKNLITTNKDLHIKISEDLLSKEEINKDEFDKYFA